MLDSEHLIKKEKLKQLFNIVFMCMFVFLYRYKHIFLRKVLVAKVNMTDLCNKYGNVSMMD